MAKKIKNARMGRPRIAWDAQKIKQFELLMSVEVPFVKEQAVADIMGVSLASLKRWIREHYDTTFELLNQKKLATAKLSLTANMYGLAMKGSVPMCIWLSKQWLGHKDKHETDLHIDGMSIKIDQVDGGL